MVHVAIVVTALASCLQHSAAMQTVFPYKMDYRKSTQLASKNPGNGCVAMTNRGTHSTVQVAVGTPPQTFEVIADTGSNSLIVPSCVCQQLGSCSSGDHCFTGGNHSNTFQLEKPYHKIGLHFGSGSIFAVLASDVVSVGGVDAQMNDGLVLMYKRLLNLKGPFEGILGLGIPKSMFGTFKPVRFLEKAGTDTFSLCMNKGAAGVLRLGNEMPKNELGSVGYKHWGVGLAGVSAVKGAKQKDPLIWPVCDPSKMGANQDTPCGLIPDSGTTSIMGPPIGILKLFANICDAWPRCARTTKRVKVLKRINPLVATRFKAVFFMRLVRKCEKFDLKELPKIKFQLTGATDGEVQMVELAGWHYIMETTFTGYNFALQHLTEILPKKERASLLQASSETSAKRVCTPAFGHMPMKTVKNGDVWIMGTPLFYAYNVHYNMKAEGRPSMSFVSNSKTPCGSCDAKVDLMADDSAEGLENGRPRFVDGPWRLPNFEIQDEM